MPFPSGREKDTKDAAVTSPFSAMPTKTVQPFMPGIAEMIAQQLSMGGFGAPESNLASMLQYYAPMQVPDYSPQATPVPTPAPTPAPGQGGIGGNAAGNGTLGKRFNYWNRGGAR